MKLKINKPQAVVNAEDADEIRRLEAEKDSPFADPQAQFTGTIFEGLHIPGPVTT